MTYKLQDPGDTLTWTHDWTEFLAGGDSISARLWSIDPDASPSHLSNGTTAIVTVAGLQAGQVYLLTEKITTAAGVVAERSLTLRCEEM